MLFYADGEEKKQWKKTSKSSVESIINSVSNFETKTTILQCKPSKTQQRSSAGAINLGQEHRLCQHVPFYSNPVPVSFLFATTNSKLQQLIS